MVRYNATLSTVPLVVTSGSGLSTDSNTSDSDIKGAKLTLTTSSVHVVNKICLKGNLCILSHL